MYRYLVLVWDAHNAQQDFFAAEVRRRIGGESRGWRAVARWGGVAAFDTGSRRGISDSRVLTDGRGVTFGTLFKASNVQAADLQGPRSALQNAHAILTRHWGRYVAVLADDAARRIVVLRDPSGMLPCSYVDWHGVHVFFSDLEDWVKLKVCALSIDWNYVAAAAVNSAIHTRTTALTQVCELLPGECLDFDRDRVTSRVLWHPLSVARANILDDVRAAERELRATAQRCVDSWAGLYPGVLHCLSGGLDSSILLACLSRAVPRPIVTCLTYYSRGRDLDERPCARSVANRVGVAQIERELTAREVQLNRLGQVRRSPRPAYYIAPLQRQRLEARFATESGAQAIFSGGGGDAVFFQGRSDLAIADHLRTRRPSIGFCSVAASAAQITGRSFWSLLSSSVRSEAPDPGLSGGSNIEHTRDILADGVAESVREDSRWNHPWLQYSVSALPGKRWHARSLTPPPAFYDSFDLPDDPERVYPLLSQPLVEVCLRIPTYLLICGGQDRAIARRAFAAELPPGVAARRVKGGIDHLGAQILFANIPFIRDLLLDGLLVRERILDRSRLEACLRSPQSMTLTEQNRLLHEFVSIEAWARRCSDTSPAPS